MSKSINAIDKVSEKEIQPLYAEIKDILQKARDRAYVAVNTAMVDAYWNVGKLIVERQGGEEKAEYGTHLIDYIADNLTKELGKGFTATNLKYMRQFYLAFPIRHSVRDELTWTHYRLLLKLESTYRR